MRRGSVVVSASAWHADGPGSIPGPGMFHYRCKNLALNIRDCLSLSFGGDTKNRRSLLSGIYARGSKRSHQSALEMCNLSGTPHSNLEKDNSLSTTPVLAQIWDVWSIGPTQLMGSFTIVNIFSIVLNRPRPLT